MALTKVGRGLLNTSIVDNGNATAITIDSGENIGVNVTPENSTGTWRNFEVGGANLSHRSSGANDAMLGTGFVFKTDNSEVYKNSEAVSRLFFNNSVMSFQQAGAGTAGNAISWTTAATIDASGNLGLGGSTITDYSGTSFLINASAGSAARIKLTTATSGTGITNGGGITYDTSNNLSLLNRELGSIIFYTNNADVGRIDASGNLLVGTSNAAISAGVGLKLLSGPTLAQFSVVTNTSSGASAINPFIHYNIDSAFPGYRFYTNVNGGLANFQTYDTNLSDINEKKNIVPIDSTWHCVKEWEIVNYLYNDQADDAHPNKGVIAQQIELHCPENISEFKKQDQADATYYTDEDELPDGVTVGDLKTEAQEEIVRKGVREQQMMWMAIKTIQECQDRIVALEACIEDLKGA